MFPLNTSVQYVTTHACTQDKLMLWVTRASLKEHWREGCICLAAEFQYQQAFSRIIGYTFKMLVPVVCGVILHHFITEECFCKISKITEREKKKKTGSKKNVHSLFLSPHSLPVNRSLLHACLAPLVNTLTIDCTSYLLAVSHTLRRSSNTVGSVESSFYVFL